MVDVVVDIVVVDGAFVNKIVVIIGDEGPVVKISSVKDALKSVVTSFVVA